MCFVRPDDATSDVDPLRGFLLGRRNSADVAFACEGPSNRPAEPRLDDAVSHPARQSAGHGPASQSAGRRRRVRRRPRGSTLDGSLCGQLRLVPYESLTSTTRSSGCRNAWRITSASLPCESSCGARRGTWQRSSRRPWPLRPGGVGERRGQAGVPRGESEPEGGGPRHPHRGRSVRPAASRASGPVPRDVPRRYALAAERRGRRLVRRTRMADRAARGPERGVHGHRQGRRRTAPRRCPGSTWPDTCRTSTGISPRPLSSWCRC